MSMGDGWCTFEVECTGERVVVEEVGVSPELLFPPVLAFGEVFGRRKGVEWGVRVMCTYEMYG
jgi:hypothetical protein